jgi:hypothetical protein
LTQVWDLQSRGAGDAGIWHLQGMIKSLIRANRVEEIFLIMVEEEIMLLRGQSNHQKTI